MVITIITLMSTPNTWHILNNKGWDGVWLSLIIGQLGGSYGRSSLLDQFQSIIGFVFASNMIVLILQVWSIMSGFWMVLLVSSYVVVCVVSGLVFDEICNVTDHPKLGWTMLAEHA